MKEFEILRFGTPALRQPSKEIANIDQSIINLLDRLNFTLHATPGRAAIAATRTVMATSVSSRRKPGRTSRVATSMRSIISTEFSTPTDSQTSG